MKTVEVMRTMRVYLKKTVTVPDDMHDDDVVETAWDDPSPWVNAGSREMGVELEEQ